MRHCTRRRRSAFKSEMPRRTWITTALAAAAAVWFIPVRGTTQGAIAAQPLPEAGLSAFERIVRAHHWRRKIESG
jgi:hypothetical protein